MNHYVPDFDMDEDYPIPSHAPHKKFPMDRGADEIMELLWQNGQLVTQIQRSSLKKSQPADLQGQFIQTEQSEPHQIPHNHHYHQQSPQPHQQNQNLFMQEDEMASWLHYPLNDTAFASDFCSDLMDIPPRVNSTSNASTSVTTAAVDVRMPPVPAAPRPPMPSPSSRRIENFGHLARLNKPRVDEPGPSSSNRAANDSTVVDSSDTTAAVIPRFSKEKNCEIPMMNVVAASSAAGGMRDTGQPCELTVTSSPGGSSASAEPPLPHEKTPAPPPSAPPMEDRKRKAREAGGGCDEMDWQSEDVELESADGKKQLRGSTSAKRSRAAEVHNLSERRRRDRINEKMKALQELIPHCNKADKASMLDEAIEYLKSLQLQVQMMSMGCSMVPMMFPGIQYMPSMGMGIGMGMGMEMGMNRPMMPFPGVLAGHQIPAAAAGANMGLRFPMPAFHMSHVPAPDPSRVTPNVQPELTRNPLVVQNPGQPRIPNFVDPYMQCLSMHNMQLPLQQQQTIQPYISKPSTGKGAEDVEKHQPGTKVPFRTHAFVDLVTLLWMEHLIVKFIITFFVQPLLSSRT